MPGKALRTAAALGLAAASFGSATLPMTAAPAAAPVRAPLPATRLEFGLSNLDVTWMTSSGVPWRYRFQYLAGGTNTPNNWLTWQDPAKPPGQFALDFMTASTKSPANYIPVFTWYQLLQSLPSTGSSELERDYNNLNNALTMSSYYASFKVLMQKAGQYGGQVLVHVEPDFWGYMQQKGAGAGAGAITAMVTSSGFAEAAGFPDTLVGFASELKHLRDTYAPNALLAMHASMWSSGIDIASNTNPNIDVAAEADKTAAFLNSAGSGSWDSVFHDVDDHNAAWWELASCGTPPCVNQWFTHWWDPNNISFPNFARYLAWVAELHARTGLPQVVWQVPMGNQYFLTMNNTCGHYQDNVAPYFIAHPGQLFNAGLVAVLFGPGNSCQTSYDDSQHDGITNNNGVATTDQVGGCNACNTHTSGYADDDGGYLRIFVGSYYAGRAPCSGVTASEMPAPPQRSGNSVVITGSATGCTSPLYKLFVRYPNSQTWLLARDYAPSPTYNWTSSGLAPGIYNYQVWARDASSPGTTQTTLGGWDAYTSFQYQLTSQPCSSIIASSNPSGTTAAGNPVTITGAASGCPNPQYELFVLYPGSNTWLVAQYYSPSATYNWSTAGKPKGTYQYSVWARDASSPGTTSTPLGRWDTYVMYSYTLT